jgi:hypothetical protein
VDNGLSTVLLQCDNVHFLPHQEIDCVGNGDGVIASFIRIPYLSGFHINVRKRTEQVGSLVHDARSIAIPGKVDGEFRSLLKRNYHGSE